MTARVGSRASEHAGLRSRPQRSTWPVRGRNRDGRSPDPAALRRYLRDWSEQPPAGAAASLPPEDLSLYARDLLAPWDAPLSAADRTLVAYSLIVAALALAAMLLRMWSARREVSSRYRPAIYAGAGVLTVAFLSYVLLTVAFLTGYDRHGPVFVANDGAIWSWAPRYMDWSISVPLLVVELLAVSALVGRTAMGARAVGVAAAFLMILFGYLGGVVVDDGTSFDALLIFGGISSV